MAKIFLIQGFKAAVSDIDQSKNDLLDLAKERFGHRLVQGVQTKSFINRDGEHVTAFDVELSKRPSQAAIIAFPYKHSVLVRDEDIPVCDENIYRREVLIDIILKYPATQPRALKAA